MKTVAWLPENLKNNKFIFLLQKSMEKAGAENISMENLYKKPNKVDYIILNFYEDIQKKLNFYFISFIGKLLRLYYFKINGIKIVWIVNNKIPHDDNYKYSIKMMKHLVKLSYKIIFLCSDTEQVLKQICKKEIKWKNKIIVIPHPNYIGAYDSQKIHSIKSKNFKILFFGSIRPYKNVDVLIKSFKSLDNKNMELTIAGAVKTEQYKTYIEKLVNNSSNINLLLKYINDDEILNLILDNDIIVLPYDNKTTLNSGSVILACSCAKTFISPNIGTVKDFPNKSLFYSYTYTTDEEHIEILKKMIGKSFECFINQRNDFEEKGKELYNYMKEDHSIEKIANQFKKEFFLS